MEAMEDDIDIDIEEHDVMDNPRIRDMFPDLGIVKEEPQDDSDQESYSEHDHFRELQEQYKKSDNEDDNASNYDINADALPYESQLPESAQNYCDIYTGQSNVIILGTKPPSEPILKEKLPAFVVLEDWAEILKNNPCFCHDCGTLFPTENVLHAHNMSSHSFLIAITNNVAKKSTSTTLLPRRHQGELCDIKTNKCNHCNTYFPDGTALIKHLYELLPSKEVVEANTPKAADKPNKKVIVMQSQKHYKCILCKEILPGKNKAKKHRDVEHPEMGRRRLYQVIFKSFNENQIAKTIERPVKKLHTVPLAEPKVPPAQTFKYKCTGCLMWFDSSYLARTHRAYRHPEKYGQNLFKKYVCKAKADVKVDKSKIKSKITGNLQVAKPKSKSTAPKTIATNSIVAQLNNREFIYHFSRGVLIKNPPIQLSLLYKCQQCNVHFIVGYSVINHFKQCRRSTPFEVCAICKRKICKKDSLMHKYQHVFSDRFRIFTNIDWIFYKKLLCLCPKCNVYFTEYRFWSHYIAHPDSVDSKTCEICNVEVNKSCHTFHKSYHRLYKMQRKDIVLIEFRKFDDVGMKRKTNAPALPTKKIKLQTNSEIDESNIRLYYCSMCNCCSHRLTQNDCHFKKNCHSRPKRYCDICGLSFLNKGLRIHQKWHSRYQLNLNNIRFQTHEGEQILPEPPTFDRCENCDAYYDKDHNCTDENYVCRDCEKKFTAKAYKLHVPFHELKSYYEKNEIHKMWNIIYYCDVCKFSVDTYDRAIRHSQNHLFDESMNQLCEKCEVCDLNLHYDCINKHKSLHDNMNLTKTDFLILKFDYKSLLQDKWLELFRRLPQTTVQEIISKSLHGNHRDVKMKLKRDGPIDSTIYFCHVCEICISSAMISKHAYKNCRKNDKKYHCDKCFLYFDTSENFNKHTKEHDSTNEFRIIEFKYESNVKEEKVPEEREPVAEVGKRIFYQCSNCKIAIKNRKNTSRHNCGTADIEMCKKCGLYYYSKKSYRHDLLHEKDPELTIENVVVKSFKTTPKKIQKEVLLCKVYKCPCGMHYTTIDSAKKHVKNCSRDKIPADNCIKCGLLFPTKDLPDHLRKDHKSPSNIIVENIPILNLYKCGTCHLLFNNRYELSKHKCGEDGQKCDNCELKFHIESVEIHSMKHASNKCGIFFNNIVKLRNNAVETEKKKVSDDSEMEASCSSIVESSESNANSEIESIPNVDSPSSSRYKFKLYKCSDCDVYFTNQNSFQKHVNKHEKLNELDYIECKLCGLQFLVIQLHNHLKNHHKSTVRMEDILIEEYKVNMASNKMAETYCAVDRVQFKTVSSTKIENQIKTEPE